MQKKFLVLGVGLLLLVGCATSTSYVSYTFEHYPPKDPYTNVNVYSETQPLTATTPYYVIGKVSIEGFASNGVTPGSLTKQAMDIAKRKGADAIINASTQVFRYYYGDVLLRFKGELIVFSPAK